MNETEKRKTKRISNDLDTNFVTYFLFESRKTKNPTINYRILLRTRQIKKYGDHEKYLRGQECTDAYKTTIKTFILANGITSLPFRVYNYQGIIYDLQVPLLQGLTKQQVKIEIVLVLLGVFSYYKKIQNIIHQYNNHAT